MIEIDSLTKRYGSSTVVDRASLAIARGSICVIVGTSGSGKSTLLRMLNRLVEPTSGQVLIDGKDTRSQPAHLLRRRIGYAIQGHGLFPHRTVAENIGTVPKLLRWNAARMRTRVDELLEIFQLDPAEYGDKFPHELSGGQQQRVGVARALAGEPNILLMDEPFGALDPLIRTKAQDDLLDVQRRFGTTIVLVTHDIDEAFRLGDRIAVMNRGKVLQYGTPATLLRSPADPFVSLLIGTGDRAMKLLALTTAGQAIESGAAAGCADGAFGIGVADGPTVHMSATLRDVLSELVWSGAPEATVIDAEGKPSGRLTLADILARGRPS